MSTRSWMSRLALASFALTVAGVLGLPEAAPAAQGSAGLITTVWDCTNGDTATFLLPAAAVSPGAGATVAPFPGRLTAYEGPTVMRLGTWVVLGSATQGPLPASFGAKVGLTRSEPTTCTLQGVPLMVTIAPVG